MAITQRIIATKDGSPIYTTHVVADWDRLRSYPGGWTAASQELFRLIADTVPDAFKVSVVIGDGMLVEVAVFVDNDYLRQLMQLERRVDDLLGPRP